MYLSSLSKNEKKLFLQACLHVSCADGNFSPDEKTVIKQLCQEMEIPVSFEQTMSFDNVIDELSLSNNQRNKRIFIFELAGVVMADNVCEDSEKEMMYKIAEKLNINTDFVDEAIDKITRLINFYQEIGEFIS